MPFKKTVKATSTALAIALAAAPMATLVAQGASAQDAQEYSGEKLDAFTVALLEVVDVRQKYNPMLQSAESEEQQQTIIEEANNEIIGVIESAEGVSVDEYMQISEAAGQDQALNARIMKRVEAMRATQ